ncbi:MAG: class I SAM-dependent methyltransferase [Ignavibacteriales bacterium]|nr:class I SAM-dependent methyltransferase [Ignavibacteriales bacterium]
MQNKNHWYDGWFYDKLIAPNQDRMFGEIKNLIEPNSSVIDVGCGTGRFSFSIADKVSKVVGVDLSSKNITTSNQTLQKNPNNKISFLHTKLSNLISQNHHFDYGVMTYVIHEVNPEDRITLLIEVAQIADKIIIGDYLVPTNKGFWGMLNQVVEFAAGNEHYTNFKDFVKNDGLTGLTKAAKLKVVKEVHNKPVTSQVMILEK